MNRRQRRQQKKNNSQTGISQLAPLLARVRQAKAVATDPKAIQVLAEKERQLVEIQADIKLKSDEVRNAFKELMELSGMDPTALDHVTEEQMGSKNNHHFIAAALEKLGEDPIFCYAIRRTGTILRDRSHATPELLVQWDAAMAEGKAMLVGDGVHRRRVQED